MKPENVIPYIHGVLATGKIWENKSVHLPVEDVVNAVLTISGMERKPIEHARYGIVGFDTNGWQWDWWQHFTYEGKSYILGGSGYYGGLCFALDTD